MGQEALELPETQGAAKQIVENQWLPLPADELERNLHLAMIAASI
jgi:hypothetical protein